MEVTNTTSFKLSVEDLKLIVQKEITNIHFITEKDEVNVHFDITNDPTWEGPGTSPILMGASVSVVRKNIGCNPSPPMVVSNSCITDIKKGNHYRDGGSYDVLCVINGCKHKFFRNCGIGGNKKLYMRANFPDLVKEDVAKVICDYLDK